MENEENTEIFKFKAWVTSQLLCYLFEENRCFIVRWSWLKITKEGSTSFYKFHETDASLNCQIYNIFLYPVKTTKLFEAEEINPNSGSLHSNYRCIINLLKILMHSIFWSFKRLQNYLNRNPKFKRFCRNKLQSQVTF